MLIAIAAQNVRMKAVVGVVLVMMFLLQAQAADAQEAPCGRVVVVGLPGLTWEMVQRYEPPAMMRIAETGAVGAVSVRTNSSHTTYASGYLTIGAGTRAEGGQTSGGSISSGDAYLINGVESLYLDTRVVPTGFREIVERADETDYRPPLGALAGALQPRPVVVVGNGDPGLDPPVPLRLGRFALLAGMGPSGVVRAAAVGSDLLVADAAWPWAARTDETAMSGAIDDALAIRCSVVIVDQGDLMRLDSFADFRGVPPESESIERALRATDSVVAQVEARLDPTRDLLLLVSPTSPSWEEETHLGVAIAWGPGFPAGTALTSALTRQPLLVTLPDVAPTILDHVGRARPAGMVGRPFSAVAAPPSPIAAAADLDRESVFVHSTKAQISTAFVLGQIALYLAAFVLLSSRSRFAKPASASATRWLEIGGLAVAAFPLVTYLQSPIPAHQMEKTWYFVALVALDVALVGTVVVAFSRPLDRLLAITASTSILLVGDLLVGTNLQLNAVWGNDPIVAGRFSGLGNIAFSLLGTSTLMSGALVVERWPKRRWIHAMVATGFAVTVVVDGAPSLGSDVGGILALVPALSITWLMLTGRRPTLKVAVVTGLVAVVVLVLFLLFDLSRPSTQQTHLARLWQDISARGTGAFREAIERKVRTNLNVFRSTIWTYLVPPAVGIIGMLLLRPRRRWRELAQKYPRLRAGLVGSLLLGILGFAVNDSGVVVPAIVLSLVAPMVLLIHVTIERAGGSMGADP